MKIPITKAEMTNKHKYNSREELFCVSTSKRKYYLWQDGEGNLSVTPAGAGKPMLGINSQTVTFY